MNSVARDYHVNDLILFKHETQGWITYYKTSELFKEPKPTFHSYTIKKDEICIILSIRVIHMHTYFVCLGVHGLFLVYAPLMRSAKLIMKTGDDS